MVVGPGYDLLGDLALANRQLANVYDTALRTEDTRQRDLVARRPVLQLIEAGQIEAGVCLRDVERIMEVHTEHLTIDELLWHSMQARYALETGQLASAKAVDRRAS